jgi:hypothetical protein
MGFFKRDKQPEKKQSKPKTLREVATERVLTAEGWRRRLLRKAK